MGEPVNVDARECWVPVLTDMSFDSLTDPDSGTVDGEGRWEECPGVVITIGEWTRMYRWPQGWHLRVADVEEMGAVMFALQAEGFDCGVATSVPKLTLARSPLETLVPAILQGLANKLVQILLSDM